MEAQRARWKAFLCSVMVEWARAALVLPPPLVTDSSSDELDPEHSDTEADDRSEGVDVHDVRAEWARAVMAFRCIHHIVLHHRWRSRRVQGDGLVAASHGHSPGHEKMARVRAHGASRAFSLDQL